MTYLIAGLGNPGIEYEKTRHNIGFMIMDKLCNDVSYAGDMLALTAKTIYRDLTYFLIKPTTYINLSGEAILYHLQLHKLTADNLLVIVDDISLPFGTVRIRKSGSDGGHNGLKNITKKLGTDTYPRLRVGVSNNFTKGSQIDYVLSPFTTEEQRNLDKIIEHCAEAALQFGFLGADKVTHAYNKKLF